MTIQSFDQMYYCYFTAILEEEIISDFNREIRSVLRENLNVILWASCQLTVVYCDK